MGLSILLILFFFCFLQGFTEFLPISSQGHLIVFSEYYNFNAETGISVLESTIIAHFGSLFAVILYYINTIKGFVFSLKLLDRPDIDKNSFLLVNLIISSFPLVLVGYIFTKIFIHDSDNILLIIGVTSIIFGILLFVVDGFCLRIKNLTSLNYYTSLLIGLCQCMALVPGVSRSGSVITAMRLFGFQRKFAVFYSNLLSVPAISAATGYLLISNIEDLSTSAMFSFHGIIIFVGSLLFSLVFIFLFIAWTKKFSFFIFAFYRLLFGIFLIYFFI